MSADSRADRAGGATAADGERGEAQQADTQPRPTPECDICGAPMLELHCKLVCTRCGYKRDCSDP